MGGGLTSPQIVIRALEQGYGKVVLLLRGHLKSKPFDFDLGWVGRYSNYLKMQFWQSDSADERLAIVRTARNGGSVTPTYAKVLSRLQALGLVEVKMHTQISAATYAPPAPHDPESDSWNQGETEGAGEWTLSLRTNSRGGQEEQIRAAYLILATGSRSDFSGLDFLQGL